MQTNYYLIPLVTSLTIALVSTVKAAEQIPLQTDSFRMLQQQFQFALPGLTKLTVASPDVLQFIQQSSDQNQIRHIRMQQQYLGFDVYGGYVILHSRNSAKHVLTAPDEVQVNGIIYHNLQNDLQQPAGDFEKNTQLALDEFKTQFQEGTLSEGKVTPIVYVDQNQIAHWAYRVSLVLQQDRKIPEKPTAIIDAKTYQPFLKWNDMKTVNSLVKGKGFGGNTKTGRYIFDGTIYPLLEITRNTFLQTCYMENSAVKVLDMKHKYNSFGNPMTFSCKRNVGTDTSIYWTGYEGDGYDKNNGAFSPINDAMYSGHVIKHMYLDWYKVEVLTKKDPHSKKFQPMQLVMRVHYGNNYENAYWDGKQMTFGDGDKVMYPLVSLEIGAHEISHGFTEQHSNLEYIAHSGGINESFSDMAAKAAEFYSTNKNTWTIGAEIIKEGNTIDALRYMDKPSRDHESIDAADQYTEGLDVHFSSGVFNRLFYLMATTKDWNAQKAFEVMVKANMDYWIPTTTFEQAGCGVLKATSDLNYSLDEVKMAFLKVAIDSTRCS